MAAVRRPNWLRWWRTINHQGFTLIEVVIVIIIIGVLSVIIAAPLMEGTRGWVDVTTRKDLAQQGRLAMERMIREIRNTGRKADTNPCISAATPTAYTFSDASGDLVNCNSTSFTFSGSQIRRGPSDILADHVSSFQLIYFNNSNNSTGSLSAIRRVSVAITFSNGAESLSLNGEVYLRNMKGY